MILFHDFCLKHYEKCLFPNENPFAYDMGSHSRKLFVTDDNGKCLLDLHRCVQRTSTSSMNSVASSTFTSRIVSSSDSSTTVSTSLDFPIQMRFWLWMFTCLIMIYFSLSISLILSYKLVKTCKKRKTIKKNQLIVANHITNPILPIDLEVEYEPIKPMVQDAHSEPLDQPKPKPKVQLVDKMIQSDADVSIIQHRDSFQPSFDFLKF